ncbi:class I SAM-dependent methyltransferase [Candidatus Uabimicrobium amorphum]|uniref:Uncharacterized protein n=1 Tax=Uabimicrobium amorphum TaxID=2596890 RepID=A0A5S9ITD3_UABAM|nr:class I SAM-dependent methyltransferase [Candidatus Uabimicrobium amorphum]BBM87584.1 hypothetical protein UABAM_05996 [Candidatus Uabimicrobium amorphum]
MDLIESNQLANEKEHWWIKTRFRYILRALNLIDSEQQQILEVGCGTCQNLAFLRESPHLSSQIHRVVGFDPLFKDIPKFSWQKTEDVFVNTLPATSKKSFDCLLAMDVLEHLQDDEHHLRLWLDYMHDDGIILITVPAFPSLWSYHDELLHHYRRYTKKTLLSLTEKVGLRPVLLTYAFSYVFPLVYLIRKLSRKQSNTDLQQSHFLINAILYSLGKTEAFFGGNPFFGTSVVGIFTDANSNRNSLLQ